MNLLTENICKGCFTALFLFCTFLAFANPPKEHNEILRKGCILTQKDSLFGIQCKKEIFAEPIYRQIVPAAKQFVALQNTKGQWLFMNQAGKFITSKAVDSFSVAKDTLIIIKEDHKWGLLGLSGRLLLPSKYRSIIANSYGNVLAQQFNQYTVYDGSVRKFEKEAEYLMPMNASEYVMKIGKDISALNLKGEKLKETLGIESVDSQSPAKSKATDFVSINKAMQDYKVKLSGPEGQDVLTNAKGKVLWRGNWSLAVVTCVDSMIYIKRDRRLEAIINPKGEQALEHFQKYEIVEDYNDSYARVKRAGKWGFISRNGGLFVATQYDTVTPCSQFRAGVMLKNKWAVIDLHEHLLAQPYYDSVGQYTDSVVIVKKEGKYGLLDYQGKELFIPKYDKIVRLAPKLYKVKRSRKFGILNSKGVELVFTKYDEIPAASADYLVYSEFGKLGVINWKDQVLIPAEQEKILLNPYNKDIILQKKGICEVHKF